MHRIKLLALAGLALCAAAPLAAQQLGNPGAPDNPAAGNVYLGASNQLCLGFTLQQNTNNSLVSFSVTNFGDAFPSNWESMSLTANGNPVPASVTSTDDFTTVFELHTPEPFGATPKLFQVLVSVSEFAEEGRTFELEVQIGDFNFSLPGATDGPPVVGGVQTIVEPLFTSLEIAQQPQGGTGGSALDPAPSVQLLDSVGDPANEPGVTVTAAIVEGAGPDGAQIVAGAAAVTNASGLATFTNLAIDLAGTGYRLIFSADGFQSDETEAFDIVPGPAASLRVLVQPGGAIAGHGFTTPPRVELLDAGGNPVTADNVTEVSALILDGTGTAGAVLSGQTTVTVSDGVAVWNSISINLTGSGYQLRFESAGLGETVSAAFNVTTPTGPGPGAGGGGGCALRLGSGQAGILMLLGLLALTGLSRRRKEPSPPWKQRA